MIAGRAMSGHEKKNHVSVRLEPEIMSRVDALIPRFSTSVHVGTRSDVVRALIVRGLEREKRGENTDLPEPEEAVRASGRSVDD